MSNIFFVTATGTDIGKTFVSTQKLYKEMVGRTRIIKPIISGFKYNDYSNDTYRILEALNIVPSKTAVEEISPWRFKEALSPNIAASIEGIEVNFMNVVNFCQKEINSAKERRENLLIEGAGGVMTPISEYKTFCDLIKELQIPVILVIGNYLGTISHTLTAISALESYKIEISKILLNCKAEDNIDYESNLSSLKNFTNYNIEVFKI